MAGNVKKKNDEKKYFSQSFIVCKVEEKWVKIKFYKFIGCIGKKMDEYNFWVIFQQFKKKKKFCSRSAKRVLGHCPNCIVNLYCKPCNCIASLAIVLQERELEKNCRKKKFCITIPFLYCREEGLRVGKCIAIHYIILQRRNGL